MITWLKYYACMAILIFLAGIIYRFTRYAYLFVTRKRSILISSHPLDPPQNHSFIKAVGLVLSSFYSSFANRFNPLWAGGVLCYHIGALGHLVLDSPNTVNLLMFVLGYHQIKQSLSPVNNFLMTLSWTFIILAFVGSGIILMTYIMRRNGGTCSILGDVSKDIGSKKANPNLAHLLISILVFLIVITEILSRFEIIDYVLLYHAFFELTLFMIIPYTYLFHILTGFVSLIYAARRRQRNIVA